MANSVTTLDLVSTSQAAKEVTVNALLDAVSPASLFGRRALTSAGLSFGLYGGMYRQASGTPILQPPQVLTCTANATNFVFETDGVVSRVTVSPGGWPGPLAGGAKALYQIVAGGSTVTSYLDLRC